MCQEIKIVQHNTDIMTDRMVCAAVIIIAQEGEGGALMDLITESSGFVPVSHSKILLQIKK